MTARNVRQLNKLCQHKSFKIRILIKIVGSRKFEIRIRIFMNNEKINNLDTHLYL
jgi:hypothetical protein